MPRRAGLEGVQVPASSEYSARRRIEVAPAAATVGGVLSTTTGGLINSDPRVEELAGVFDSPKVAHATIEYLNFPAISREALRDPSYIASLRQVDALAHVLRVFSSDTVPHEKGSVDPLRDLADVEMELVLSDLVVEKREPTSSRRSRCSGKRPPRPKSPGAFTTKFS